MALTSADLFEAVGDRWNAHPEREQVSTGLIARVIRGPSWTECQTVWRVEGYAPDGEPERAQPKPKWVDEPVKVSQGRDWLAVQMRNENGPKYRAPDPDTHWHDLEEIKGLAKPLTEDQLLVRKRQRAAVKARLTRAANKAKRERDAVKAILSTL